MVYQGLQRSQAVRSPQLQSTPTTIYSFAVIVEPVATDKKERQCLTAYFKKSPFPFEIDEWAKTLMGNDYRVADSFPLQKIEL